MGVYYLVMDDELRTLLDQFSQNHPEGAKEVLKLVLKLYLKLVDKSRRKGSDPLLIFQNLVERIITGKLYETTQDRIDHLDTLLEERQASTGLLENNVWYKELLEIKNLLRDLKGSGYRGAPYAPDLREFSPKDSAKLLDVDRTSSGQKKRKSYRELRKVSTLKKIEF
ncbi:MAG: hypothetical protein HY787_01350 [Deltaproteobacteria bacterium]|nr:hypothetical protein [Deltaproteobacteria bacterium]